MEASCSLERPECEWKKAWCCAADLSLTSSVPVRAQQV